METQADPTAIDLLTDPTAADPTGDPAAADQPDETGATDQPAEPTPSERPVDPWPRSIAIASVTAIALVLVGIVVGVLLQLSAVRATNSLSATRATLHSVAHRLSVDRADLSAATTQSTAAGILLAGNSAKLTQTQAALAKAQANIYAKGVNISDLDTCLSGVEQTLNQIAVGDPTGAASTLSGVAGTCRAALPAGS